MTSARAEALWLLALIAHGKMDIEEVVDLLEIPADVRSVWLEAATTDAGLAAMISRAATFRNEVAGELETLLGIDTAFVQEHGPMEQQGTLAHTEKKPSCRINFRIETELYERVQQLVQESGAKDLSGYIRGLLVKAVSDSSAMAVPATQAAQEPRSETAGI